MDWLWIVVLLLLGLAMLLAPRRMWKLEHLFSVKDGEPTDLYLAGLRLGGVFFMVCAVVITGYVLMH